MHYAVPSIIHGRRSLKCLYTDFDARGMLGETLRRKFTESHFGLLARIASRSPAGVPRSLVQSAWLLGLAYGLAVRRARSEEERQSAYLRYSARFAKWVADQAWPSASAVYTFNTAALEILQRARTEGRVSFVEQTIAPKEVEIALLSATENEFPDWAGLAMAGPAASGLAERERAEWETASVILCGSAFVRDSVITCGGPGEKCQVVPYGVKVSAAQPRPPRQGPLRVVTVGALGLRKGTPYVLASAQRIGSRATFRLVGPGAIPASCRVPPNVELVGAVPRPEVERHLAWADVFLLPSICEGSATASYEALAAGLPVICTPNTGAVITDRVEGFLVPVGSVSPIVASLRNLADDRRLVAEMSAAASRLAQFCSVDAYGQRLAQALCLVDVGENVL